jgi:outer membrane protein OmpA-like peptidoglycan-associated protein
LQKDIASELAKVNAQLNNAKPGSEEQYCMLYAKNELLDLYNNAPLSPPMPKAKVIEKKIIIKENIAEQNQPMGPNPLRNNEELPVIQREIQRTENTVYYKPDSTNFLNKTDYENLRKEIQKLRSDVATYRELAAKSQTTQTPVIIKRPLFGRKAKQTSNDEEAMQLAIAKLRKDLKPTIIRDTIVIEKIVEKPVIQYVDKVIEKVVERPTIQYIDKVVDRPVEKIVEKTVTKVEQLLSLPPDVILFDVAKSNIKAQYNTRLNYYATQLKKFDDLQVTLNGYTDNSGNALANQKLSEARAKAVKQFLISKGVKESQININFAGAADPIADNATASNKSQNRRVEISFNK